jgi:hypothetical protein
MNFSTYVQFLFLLKSAYNAPHSEYAFFLECNLKKKRHIQFFIFWLVAMQLISPFLHAHAFGVGAVHSSPGVHIHLDEIDSAPSENFDKATVHNEALPEHSISMTTGVSEKSDFEFLAPAFVTFISLTLYLAYVRRFYPPKEAPLAEYQTHSPPRAPPTYL